MWPFKRRNNVHEGRLRYGLIHRNSGYLDPILMDDFPSIEKYRLELTEPNLWTAHSVYVGKAVTA